MKSGSVDPDTTAVKYLFWREHQRTLVSLAAGLDSRLVTLSREGHERAFDEIVRRYREPLVSFAGTIVPAHLAEDVLRLAEIGVRSPRLRSRFAGQG